MKRTMFKCLGVMLLLGAVGVAVAQRGGGFGGGGGGRGGRGGGRGGGQYGGVRDLSVEGNRDHVGLWENDPGFKRDVFTFVRIIYDSPVRKTRGNGWRTDYPDSDLNFSYRLQQLTSLKVEPVPIQMRLTDERLFDYPFIYMLEIGNLEFTPEEVVVLRKYLLNGGFLMVDDHWGVAEYETFHEEMKRVFPEEAQEPRELPLEHPIFHCVFDMKEKPQIPAIEVALAHRYDGVTWEREDAKEPHFRGIFDNKGRMMVVICSNTDLGDGWEREGESEWYFHEFSEKKGYPMGVNIVFYAMTH